MPYRQWSMALLLAGLALAPAQAQAQAQQADPQASAAEAEPDLYVQALKAISEGNKDQANKTLARMIAKGPRHASEWLDLAMIQCAIGYGDDAERLFNTIEERFDPPQGIRDIILQQRLRGCVRWKPASQLSFQAGRGYDRNVNQGASNPTHTLGGTGGATLELLPEFLPQSDQYSVVAGDLVRQLSEAGTVVFAQGQLRRNDRLSNYNTASLFGGFEQPWQFGRWRVRGTVLGGALMLGGRLYQQQGQLQLRVTPPLPLPRGVELYGLAGLSHVTYETLTNFDSATRELRAVLLYRTQQSQAQFSAGFQHDHATGLRPGGNRSGWTFALATRHRISGTLQAEFDLSQQSWQSQSAYSPSLIDPIRRQRTGAARAALVYLLNERQSVQLEARHVHNQENISIFQYNNTVLQLSWRWNGF